MSIAGAFLKLIRLAVFGYRITAHYLIIAIITLTFRRLPPRISRSNAEKRRSVMKPERVKIFDTTLRDGEQSPGCSMNLKEKVRLARKLQSLVVDIIEAGFPI